MIWGKTMWWKILKVWQKVTYSHATWLQNFLQFHKIMQIAVISSIYHIPNKLGGSYYIRTVRDRTWIQYAWPTWTWCSTGDQRLLFWGKTGPLIIGGEAWCEKSKFGSFEPDKIIKFPSNSSGWNQANVQNSKFHPDYTSGLKNLKIQARLGCMWGDSNCQGNTQEYVRYTKPTLRLIA